MSITTNKSFVDLYFKLLETDGLRRKGLDYLVQGFEHLPNPFRLDLTEVEKRAVTETVHGNFWYFVKELSFVPVYDGKRVRFQINKTNLASLVCLNEGISAFASQPRQLYGTMTRAIFVLWKIITSFDNICVISRTKTNSMYFVEKVKDLNSALPQYLQVEDKYIESRIRAIGCRSDIDFLKTYKGLVVINDLEECDNMSPIFKNLKEPVLNKDVIFTANSTVGPISKSGRVVANKLIDRVNHWESTHFNSVLKRKELGSVTYIMYPYTELVDNPEEWYESQCKYLNHDQYTIDREVLLKR